MRLLPLLLVFASGCATYVSVGRYKLAEDSWKTSEAALRARAAFELKCPDAQLSLTVLTVSEFDSGIAAQVGVEGCEHRLVYVNGYVNGWVLNSDSGPTGK